MEDRRVLLERRGTLYGVDYIDVEPEAEGRWRLKLSLFTGAAPAARVGEGRLSLTETDVRIIGPGGVRADVSVTRVEPAAASRRELVVHVAALGGTDPAASPGIYHLQLSPQSWLDPLSATAPFSLRSDPLSEIDPGAVALPEPEAAPAGPIDYLAKDYASFRKTMIDQMALEIPDWRERNPADLGIALIETLAYAADYLSYYQDGVATEAYLETARRRLSMRRHGRLLDYHVRDGCNSRVWVRVDVDADDVDLPAGTPLIACDFDLPLLVDRETYRLQVLRNAMPVHVFETMHDKTLHQKLNTVHVHAWGSKTYDLKAGATSACLEGHHSSLRKGDVVVFERLDPADGGADSSKANNRAHPVRLIEAPRPTRDPLTDTEITEIRWYCEDALPFPMPVSRPVSRPAATASGAEPCYVVAGNIVLADYGRTELEEPLPSVPVGARYRPRLRWRDVTYAEPMDGDALEFCSAADMLRQDRDKILPVVSLRQRDGDGPGDAAAEPAKAEGPVWTLRHDLLSSNRFARDFVVETDLDGSAMVRFGDGFFGRRPDPGTKLAVRYRTGSGRRGNVAAAAIAHVVSNDGRITGVRNPLPASGGIDAETGFQIRARAPLQLRRQKRCITEEDFADAARAFGEVRDAVAEARWTGSWRTMFIWVQRTGGETVDDVFRREFLEYLRRRRPMGLDLEVRGPDYVPLDIALGVQVREGAPVRLVERRLLEAFGNRVLADGREGFFYPDRMSFGETLYLSDVIAAATDIDGVAWVEPKRFRRFDTPEPESGSGSAVGVLHLSRREIARVDNDAMAPQRGRIVFRLSGESR